MSSEASDNMNNSWSAIGKATFITPPISSSNTNGYLCESMPCIHLYSVGSRSYNPVLLYKSNIDASNASDLCLEYSLGFAFDEYVPPTEIYYVEYHCNGMLNDSFIILDSYNVSNLFHITQFNRKTKIFDSICDNNHDITLRFRGYRPGASNVYSHLYIDSVILYPDCSDYLVDDTTDLSYVSNLTLSPSQKSSITNRSSKDADIIEIIIFSLLGYSVILISAALVKLTCSKPGKAAQKFLFFMLFAFQIALDILDVVSDIMASNQFIFTSTNNQLMCRNTQCGLPDISIFGYALIPFMIISALITLGLNILGISFCCHDKDTDLIEINLEYGKLFFGDFPCVIIYMILWNSTSETLVPSTTAVFALMMTVIDIIFTVARAAFVWKRNQGDDKLIKTKYQGYQCLGSFLLIFFASATLLGTNGNRWNVINGKYGVFDDGCSIIAISAGDECITSYQLDKDSINGLDPSTNYYRYQTHMIQFNVSDYDFSENEYYGTYGDSVEDLPRILKFYHDFSFDYASDFTLEVHNAGFQRTSESENCMVKRFFDDDTEDITSESYCKCEFTGIDQESFTMSLFKVGLFLL